MKEWRGRRPKNFILNLAERLPHVEREAQVGDGEAHFTRNISILPLGCGWHRQLRSDYETGATGQSSDYDDFGNFDYGATGAVFIYSLSTLEQGAVAARMMKSWKTQLKKYGLGNPPHKNEMIRQGMQYKQNDCGKS